MNEKKRKQGYKSILIGESGELLICQLFISWGWLPRKQSLDQGIDLIVEVADEGRGLGAHFAVQSKATGGNIKFNSTGISVPLSGKNIEYLLRQKMPVVLMFAANQDQLIYWVDARRAIKQSSRKQNGSALLKIPTSNVFHVSNDNLAQEANRKIFLESIIPDAHLPPALSLIDAVRNEEQRLSEMDPNLDVKITASRDGRLVEINPSSGKESVEFRMSISFPSKEEKEKMRETIEFGVENTISVESLKLTGSPLLRELFPNARSGKVVVGGIPQSPIHVNVRAGGLRGSAIKLSGRTTKGRLGANAVLTSGSHPISANFRANAAGRTADFTINLDWYRWKGADLVSFESLDRASSWAMTASLARELYCDLRIGDQALTMSVELSDDDRIAFEYLAGALCELADLREIVIRYKSEFRLGDFSMVSDGEPTMWKLMRGILDGEIVDMPHGAIRFSMDRSGSDAAFEKRGQMTMQAGTFVCSAFGEPICKVPVDFFLEDCSVETTLFEKVTKVVVRPTVGSVARIRRASTEPIELLKG